MNKCLRHIYTQRSFRGSNRGSNLQTHALEPGFITTRPWRIPKCERKGLQGMQASIAKEINNKRGINDDSFGNT